MIPRMVSLTRVEEWCDGEVRTIQDYLVGEEPLEIRVGDAALSVTMRTPGHDLELATGFLFTEGLIRGRDQMLRCGMNRNKTEWCKSRTRGSGCWSGARCRSDAAQLLYHVELRRLRQGIHRRRAGATDRAARTRSAASIQRCYAASRATPCFAGRFLDAPADCTLPVCFRWAVIYLCFAKMLGGITRWTRSSAGRSNENRLPLRDSMLMVSGRGGFEIVQKALMAGVPVLASVSAPSDLAVNLAREFGMTLIGFLRGRRFVIYSGAQRILQTSRHIGSSGGVGAEILGGERNTGDLKDWNQAMTKSRDRRVLMSSAERCWGKTVIAACSDGHRIFGKWRQL